MRRWPREADTPLSGLPEIVKIVDAWDAAGPKPDLIYGGGITVFKPLPVAAIRLTVGDETQTLATSPGAKEGVFEFVMEPDRPRLAKTELLDPSGKTLAGGYYVYCHFLNH